MSELLPSDQLASYRLFFFFALCQPVRKQKVASFKGLATIGYKISKHLWFYGLKVTIYRHHVVTT